MKRIHIIGRKNHGKTRLIVELVEEFVSRGISVGTIKHTHHDHELDTPGKDSHMHRMAGAAVVAVLSQNLSAVFVPSRPTPHTEQQYADLSFAFKACHLVIVEGDTDTTTPKIEVWRGVLNTTPLAAADSSILAVVTDDPLSIDTPTYPREDVPALATWILDALNETRS